VGFYTSSVNRLPGLAPFVTGRMACRALSGLMGLGRASPSSFTGGYSTFATFVAVIGIGVSALRRCFSKSHFRGHQELTKETFLICSGFKRCVLLCDKALSKSFNRLPGLAPFVDGSIAFIALSGLRGLGWVPLASSFTGGYSTFATFVGVGGTGVSTSGDILTQATFVAVSGI